MRCAYAFCFILLGLSVSAQNPKLIKNLASTVSEPNSTSQDDWWNNQWKGLFFYQGKGSPTKLCVTDGTDAGTKYIADVGTGTINNILPAKDFVYITTTIVVSFSPFTFRYEVYKSDGTAAGTSLVYASAVAPGVSNGSNFCSDQNTTQNFCLDGTTNTMLFNSYDPVNGNEIWITNGTTAGTFMLKDIKPGVNGSFPWGFMKIGNEFYFNATSVDFQRKLWKTDGTPAGTVQVNVPEPFFVVNGNVNKVGNKMIFFADNTVDGYEPYISDGTPAGTFMLANINPSGNSLLSTVQELNLRSNNTNSFMVLTNGTDTALYRTDGTPSGTIRLSPAGMSFYHGISSGGYCDIDAGGLWFIQFNTSGSGNSERIYKSDGTFAGTYLVAENISYGQKAKIYKNALWMQARNTGTVTNVEPWRSGGNQATTNKALEVTPGGPLAGFFYSSDPFGFFVTNSRLYFFAKNISGNTGLYEYNGDFTFNGSVAGGNWKDSANWNSAMPPGITDTVYVNTGTPNALTINNTKGYAGTMILGSNASIEITNGSDSLYIATELSPSGNNNFTGNGVLVSNSFNTNTVQFKNGFTANAISVESNTFLQSGTVAVNNGITLVRGRLTLNSGNLLMKGNTSSVTVFNNHYVVTNSTGTMQVENIGAGARTGMVVFPIGNTTYNPVSFTNNGTANLFGARVTEGISNSYTGEAPGALLTSNAVNRTWFITEGTAGGSNANITLQWNAADELPGFDRNATLLGHYTGGSWTVGNPGVAAGSDPYIYSRTGITSFSPFGIVNNLATPVSNLVRNNIRLNVFPNPATEKIQVSLTKQMQKENLVLQLINANGQVLMQRFIQASSVETISVHLKGISEGVYFLRLKGKTVNATTVIQKIK